MVLSSLYQVIEDLLTAARQMKAPLIGIDVGTPGPVDVDEGKIFEPPNFPGFQNIALKHIIEQRYQVPCHLNDDARTSLGEAWFGAGRTSAAWFYLFGEGIGSGSF